MSFTFVFMKIYSERRYVYLVSNLRIDLRIFHKTLLYISCNKCLAAKGKVRDPVSGSFVSLNPKKQKSPEHIYPELQ